MNANTRAVLRAVGSAVMVGVVATVPTLLLSGVGPGTVLVGIFWFGATLWLHSLSGAGWRR